MNQERETQFLESPSAKNTSVFVVKIKVAGPMLLATRPGRLMGATWRNHVFKIRSHTRFDNST